MFTAASMKCRERDQLLPDRPALARVPEKRHEVDRRDELVGGTPDEPLAVIHLSNAGARPAIVAMALSFR